MSERLTSERSHNLDAAERGGAATASSRQRAKIWSVSGLLIGAFLCVDFFAPILLLHTRFHYEWAGAVAVGLFIGQVNLIATWAVLAPGNIVVRLPWSLLLGMLMWYTLFLSCRACGKMPEEESLLLGCLLLTGVVVAQIPLWIAKRVFRWRLTRDTVEVAQSSQDDRQFHLRHLLLGIFLLALALSPLRLVLPWEAPGLPGDMGEIVVLLGAVIICNLLVTVPCIWGGLILSSSFVSAAAGWLAYCAILTLVECLVLVAILGSPGPNGIYMLVCAYVMNVAQCAAVFGPLRVFRALGFRLVQLPLAKASRGETHAGENRGDQVI